MTSAVATRPKRTAPRRIAGVVHLGLGAFFRAHGAVYLQESMAKSGGDWGVVGVSLRSPAVRDRLAGQDSVYTSVELSQAGLGLEKIDTVQEVLVAPEDPEAVLQTMAADTTRIVSLTITEKGYCRGPNGAYVDFSHPDIQHDLTSVQPKSAPGFLVRALQRRWQQDRRPFTVLSLDNLPANGHVTRQIVIELATRMDERLGQWIASEGRFPSTMVDRIVPATTEALVERVQQETGIFDPALVAHEPFRQWVVEDDFVDGIRPDLATAGVLMVSDVSPFEAMKLRMLNGTHSALAYIGSLAGHETVADAIGDAAIAGFIDGLWFDEIAPSLSAPPGVDLGDYSMLLKSRYQNPEIRHLLKQIASDGSEKLPQRILDPLFENRAAGRPHGRLLMVVAAWFRFIQKASGTGLNDPLESQIAAAVQRAGSDAELTKALLGLTSVFGGYPSDLIEHELTVCLGQMAEGAGGTVPAQAKGNPSAIR